MEDGELSADEARSLRAGLETLEATVERHPSLRVIQQMEELDRVMLWYAQNAGELLRTVEALNHNGLGTLLIMQEEVPFGNDHRDYVAELGRTWHNWVAAANTFADHMREQFKEEQPPELQAEYEQKKRELLDPHDVIAFVSRSRNVLLHRGVFNTGVTWRFTQTTQHFEANCRTDILLNRYKTWWTAPARQYIESKAPRMNFGNVVEEHAEAVGPLYGWYRERVYEYHHPTLVDFEQTAARIREIRERLEPGSMPPPDEPAHFASPAELDQALQKRATPPPPRKPRAKSKGKKRHKKR